MRLFFLFALFVLSISIQGIAGGPSDFVLLSSVDPSIQQEIKYATNDNFLKKPVYSIPACYVHKDVAQALKQVQTELRSRALGLKIFDGYRPLFVQQIMWDLIQDERYVSNPAKNKGRHTRGTAVDVTLVDLNTGKELFMPTAFDSFDESAASDFMDLPGEAIQNRYLLKDVMERYGFRQLSSEWWHFDRVGWQDDVKYPPQNFTFEELQGVDR